MGRCGIATARQALAALLRIGWRVTEQEGSHRRFERKKWPALVLAATLACGARTGLDVLGQPPASPDAGLGGDGASSGGRETGSSSGVVGSSSGGTSSGSSGSSTSPSCTATGNGLVTCGASSESCCTSLEVTGGTYYRTYTNSGTGPTGEADPATVSGFRLDKYLVTVGRFRRFVSAWSGGAGYTPPAGSGKHTHLNGGQGLVNAAEDAGARYETGWIASDDVNVGPTNDNLSCDANATWTASVGNDESLPINCVTWQDAYAFCIWDGGFLPSEAEWEYAAAGGGQQREYAWGSTAPGTTNQYAIYGCYYPDSPGCAGILNIAPVGAATLGAGYWGQLDLAGDVYEWNMDWFATYVDPCVDCAYLTGTGYRVGRGGNFAGAGRQELLPPSRFNNAPSLRIGNFGFRCARTP